MGLNADFRFEAPYLPAAARPSYLPAAARPTHP